VIDQSEPERLRTVVGSRLRSIEHELTALLAFHGRHVTLSETPDRVPNLEGLLHPVLSTIAEIADELELVPSQEPEHDRVRGTLTLLSVWLDEITPRQLARRWGIKQQHPRWAELHGRLLTALEDALRRLEGSSGEPLE
jgi:hypothetical protein